MNRLYRVVSPAEQPEDGDVSQHPGDVVHEDVPASSEQDRRTNDGIGDLAVPQDLLGGHLAAEV